MHSDKTITSSFQVQFRTNVSSGSVWKNYEPHRKYATKLSDQERLQLHETFAEWELLATSTVTLKIKNNKYLFLKKLHNPQESSLTVNIIPWIMLIGRVRDLPRLVRLPYFAFILNSTTSKRKFIKQQHIHTTKIIVKRKFTAITYNIM